MEENIQTMLLLVHRQERVNQRELVLDMLYDALLFAERGDDLEARKLFTYAVHILRGKDMFCIHIPENDSGPVATAA